MSGASVSEWLREICGGHICCVFTLTFSIIPQLRCNMSTSQEGAIWQDNGFSLLVLLLLTMDNFYNNTTKSVGRIALQYIFPCLQLDFCSRKTSCHHRFSTAEIIDSGNTLVPTLVVHQLVRFLCTLTCRLSLGTWRFGRRYIRELRRF